MKALPHLLNDSIYATFLDSVDVGIAIYDAKGNYIFVNTTLINWRNIPRSKFLSMNVHDFLGVMDVCVFDLVMEKKQRVSRLQSYRGIHSIQGESRMRMVTGTPIFNDEGGVQYVLCTLQDTESFDKLRTRLLKENKVLTYASNYTETMEKLEIVTSSPAMKNVLSIAENVACIDSSVLLFGESGSGKEVLACFIHEKSKRSDKPFVVVNCASIPENLIESELFGYEKGSFTGANKEGKAGLIESADTGTLFLDEINSLPMSIQGKLLRCLEEKCILRVGATKSKKIDFRLISATNRNLNQLISKGLFREDLYYRLQVIPIMIPPLRSRKEDIIPLCLHFLHLFCEKYNIQKSISENVLREAEQYIWPGNVREVRNFIERMVVMTPRNQTEISSIPAGMLDTTLYSSEAYNGEQILPSPSTEYLSSDYTPFTIQIGNSRLNHKSPLTRATIESALKQSHGRREEAAKILGISRRYLQYKIKEYHISSRCRYNED